MNFLYQNFRSGTFTNKAPRSIYQGHRISECPVCGRGCVLAPDNLTGGTIYVHGWKSTKRGIEFTSRCLPRVMASEESLTSSSETSIQTESELDKEVV